MKKYLIILFDVFLITIAAAYFGGCDDSGVITPVATAGKFVKTYGGGASDVMTAMIPLNDGGFMTVGFTVSFGAGNNDFYATKFNSGGDISWSKAYGTSANDICSAVAQTSDGGFIFAGNSNTTGANGVDILLIKTDGSGSSVWTVDYVVPGDQYACSVIQDADGGYLVCGFSYENVVNNADVFIMKVTGAGVYQWKKLYGGQYNDIASKMIKTSDGGYLVSGETFNFGAVLGDVYLLKLKPDFSIEWSDIYGGLGLDQAFDVIETTGHDFMIAGSTYSFGLTLGAMFLFKTDHLGNVYTGDGWPRTVGDSSGLSQALSVSQAADGSFFITGFTTNGAGNTFLSFVHYYNNSVFDFSRSYGSLTDNDKGISILARNGGFLIGGITSPGGAGNYDLMTINLPDSSGTYVSCQMPNDFTPKGGSPGSNLLPTNTIISIAAAESDLLPTLTETTAGTIKNTVCGQ